MEKESPDGRYIARIDSDGLFELIDKSSPDKPLFQFERKRSDTQCYRIIEHTGFCFRDDSMQMAYTHSVTTAYFNQTEECFDSLSALHNLFVYSMTEKDTVIAGEMSDRCVCLYFDPDDRRTLIYKMENGRLRRIAV